MTVQETIDGLRVAYPQVSDAQALIYFRHIHREILALAQIETDETTIDLTAGQREYPLPDLTNVRAAYLVKSAQDATKLTPVSTDYLDEQDPTWRNTTQQGEPVRFYVEDAVIGLEPVPNTTTSAGFPKVVVYATTYQALVAIDDLPLAVPSIRVYVEGMKRLYAGDRDPARYQQWDELYQAELHKTLAHLNGLVEDLDAPRIIPAWMKNRRVQ